MTDQPVLEFWFEFASTYSYPAAMRIEPLAREAGVKVVWRPFLLGPIFQSQGWDNSPFNIYPAKGAYMWRDMERVCDAQDIPFQRPTAFPRNGLLAARVSFACAEEPWLPAFVRSVYAANFAEDMDISDLGVIGALLAGQGQKPEPILEKAQSAENKEGLKEQTGRAKEAGLFGAPSFMVGKELFWGNDRLEQAIAWAKG